MKKVAFVILTAAALLMSSCAAVSTSCGKGQFFTDIKTGVTATSNPLGKKVGQASATNIMGWVLTGDASIDAAAQNGGIKKISHVDQHQKSVLGIFAQYETIVYGE